MAGIADQHVAAVLGRDRAPRRGRATHRPPPADAHAVNAGQSVPITSARPFAAATAACMRAPRSPSGWRASATPNFCAHRCKQRMALVRRAPECHRTERRGLRGCHRALDQPRLQRCRAIGAERRDEPGLRNAGQRRLGQHRDCDPLSRRAGHSRSGARALPAPRRGNGRAAAATSAGWCGRRRARPSAGRRW